RHRYQIDAGRRHQIRLPPCPDQRKALILEKPVARGICRSYAHVEEPGVQLVAAIDDLEQHCVIAAALVDRLQDRDISRIFDIAARITRSEVDVLDHRIQWITRIDLPVGSAVDLLVLSDGSKAGGPKRRGRGTKFYSRDPSVGAR